MNTKKLLATIPLSMLLVFALATAASAGNTASQVSHLWLQGQDLDTVYDESDALPRDIRVQVWHDKDGEDPYRLGEALQVYFQTNADLYVVVYRIDGEGQVEVLWPTSRLDDGFVYGNHTYTLPRPGSPIRLTASEVKGVEYVQAIASEYPFDLRELGIDFRFDLDERGLYGYEVSGDPFLAVNDINYAITGLEEDQAYIVTDWAHMYVGAKVEYARYSCRQCHDGNEREYRPYVDTCTTVNVYYDWGWHRNWYVRFGWYPLFYEPPYYYWDVAYARPYWNPYYPIYYSWPRYNCYTRPYPVYGWYDSPYWRGDYRVRYKSNVARYSPLYDVNRPSRMRDYDARLRDGRLQPRSVREAITRNGADRRQIDRNALVRDDRIPTRTRTELTSPTRTVRGADRDTRASTPARSGLRTDIRRTDDSRRIRALEPAEGNRGRSVDSSRSGSRAAPRERTWTRPVIRNQDRGRDSSRNPSSREERSRPTIRRSDPDRSRGSSVDRSRDTRRGNDDGSKVQRSRPTQRSRNEDRSVTPTRRQSSDRKSSGNVERSRPTSRRSSGEAKSSRSGSSGRKSSGNVKSSRGSSSSRKSSGAVKSSRSSSSSRKSSGAVKSSRSSSSSRKSSGAVKSSRSSSSNRSSANSSRSGGSRGSSGKSGGSRSRGGRG